PAGSAATTCRSDTALAPRPPAPARSLPAGPGTPAPGTAAGEQRRTATPAGLPLPETGDPPPSAGRPAPTGPAVPPRAAGCGCGPRRSRGRGPAVPRPDCASGNCTSRGVFPGPCARSSGSDTSYRTARTPGGPAATAGRLPVARPPDPPSSGRAKRG